MDSLLKHALEAITLRIQLMSGKTSPDLTDPADRSTTIELLANVSKTGILLEPREVEEWAMNNGWTRSAANELGDFAAIAAHIPRPRMVFWQENIIAVLAANPKGPNTQNHPITDECKECSRWGIGIPEFEGCLMETMRTQWAEPYWLNQCCISPGARQLAGLVNSPPAIPI